MRRTLLYLAGLALAATAIFFSTYFFGRHTTLEGELERLTAPRAAPPSAKTQGIPSLQQAEPAPTPEQPPAPADAGGQPLGDGVLAWRSPLEAPGLVVVFDGTALRGSPGDEASPLPGLSAFLTRPPSGLAIGLRALAGAAGECAGTDLVKLPGVWGPGELRAAFEAASGLGLGPRNPARATEAAAADLGTVPGERAVVILSGGEDGCGADLCGSAPPPGGSAQRVHVILLAPRPVPGAEPGMPEAGTGATPAPVFEPAWAAPYRCLAERSGGSVSVASTSTELEGALRRIAGTMESAVVVRAFHGAGQEIRGISPDGAGAWGASLRPAGGEAAPLREAALFPAAFAVPAGVYVIKGRFSGQEKTAAVAVAPGERAEVRVSFVTGEVFVQALDAAGGEIVGDSAGFRCAWGAQVLQGEDGEERVAAETCSFPSRFELAPGVYRVRARWKGVERLVEEVAVEGGASVVRTVSFGADND
jgi:hypothetical protein